MTDRRGLEPTRAGAPVIRRMIVAVAPSGGLGAFIPAYSTAASAAKPAIA